MTITLWVILALVIIGAIVAVLLLGGGFGTPQPATVNVSEQNAISNVQQQVGDRLVVTLDGNPTTGYSWEVASNDPAILRPIGEAQVTPDTSALGSGGKVTRQFEAVGAGQMPLKLIYHRPFETGVAPLKTFEMTVTVEK
jgi:inhibitor of cysteine peptidase